MSLAVSGCSGKALLPSGVIEPTIVPSSNLRGSETAEREFSFEDDRTLLRVPIDRAVYAGAVGAPKSAVLIGDVAPSVWVPLYYRAFIDERHQESFYAAALEALHTVRHDEGLDQSRYVELVTSMVQEMEYRVDPVNLAPKFPVETFLDGYGDCDDKTLLAAALLARDGYDVSILLFESEKHVALGIRAPGLDYKGTGYAYVELTRPLLVGVPPDDLSGGSRLTSQPDVIRIGTGTLTYAAADQIQYIQRRMTEMRSAMKRREADIAAEQAYLDSQRASLDAERRSVEALTDPQASAAAVRSFNEKVAQYNGRLERLDGLISEFNALVDAERYAAAHQTARTQIYERMQALRL